MVAFVKLLGIFIAGFGVAFFANPNMIKQYMDFWKTRKRLYSGAALALLIGIIFLFAASQCRWRGFIVAFGILSIIKAVCLFVFSQEKLVAFMNWWAKRPIIFLRVYALLAITLGVLLIYSV